MPRRPRRTGPAEYFHIVNRSARRVPLFRRASDYRAFSEILRTGLEQYPARLISYCLMPNHWHFVLWPRTDEELTTFIRWLSMTHAKALRRWN